MQNKLIVKTHPYYKNLYKKTWIPCIKWGE